MYASGLSPSAAAAAGRPGTLCSKIHAQYSSWVTSSPGRVGLSTNCRTPREPSASIRPVSSTQNSFSSHTSPGLASQVNRTVLPARSMATRRTGCRKPIHIPEWVSWLIRSWRSPEWPMGST